MAEQTVNLTPGVKHWRWGPLEGIMLSMSLTTTGILMYFPKISNFTWPAGAMFYNGQHWMWMQDKEPLFKRSLEVFNAMILPANARLTARKKFTAQVDKMRVRADLAYQTNLNDLSDSDLITEFKNWIEDMHWFWGFSAAPELATFGAEQELTKQVAELNKLSKQEQTKIMEGLTIPARLSFFQRAEIDAIETKLSNRDLQEHLDKFYWIDNSYRGGKRKTINDIQKELQDLQKQYGKLEQARADIQNYESKLSDRRLLLQQDFNLSSELIEQGTALGLAVSWQDDRKAEQWRQMDVMTTFLREFQVRFNLSTDEQYWLSADELLQRIEGNLGANEIIAERKRGCVIPTSATKTEIISGADARQAIKKFWEQEISKEDLSGIVASLGNGESSVTGQARIIASPAQADQFEQGEILVTGMTSPDFMPIIRKATAVITDQGGLTAHAAVVARELNIPCIVGTKNATKLISTGDTITLDVSTGDITIDT